MNSIDLDKTVIGDVTEKLIFCVLTSMTRKKSPKVAQNDFNRKMIDYDTFTKIA